MRIADFDFDIGENSMPSESPELRGRSRDSGRMIVLDRAAGTIEHRRFRDICTCLRPGDLLVLNDSYMLPNTLSFERGSQPFEVSVYGQEPDGTSIVEIEPRDQAEPGLVLRSADDGELICTLLALCPDGLWNARFEPPACLFPTLDRYGRRSEESVQLDPAYWRAASSTYRSVYATRPGSLEPPSAGLHFSPDLLRLIADKGVETAFVTLHVGAAETFAVRHIQADSVEDHKMRAEYFEVGSEAAARISRALAEGRRILAVGTTVLRTLESLALGTRENTEIKARSGWTDLYIYPGFRFRVANGLLTNLHQPRSSHVVLTAAFGGMDLVMRAYADIARTGGYEFDIFGDSMLIL